MFFFFKQKTAYEISTRDWSSDVCSSDLMAPPRRGVLTVFRSQGLGGMAGHTEAGHRARGSPTRAGRGAAVDSGIADGSRWPAASPGGARGRAGQPPSLASSCGGVVQQPDLVFLLRRIRWN